MTRLHRVGLLLALAGVVVPLGAAVSAAGRAQEEPFPHARHEGLFPLCTGCHEGVPTGDRAEMYPAPSLCAGCHDGTERARVSWSPPEARAGNLLFTHPAHADVLAREGEPAQTCEACHSAPGGRRMAVSGDVQLGTCWSCHQATDHTSDAPCATCHVSLAESALDLARVEAMPTPADHADDAFLREGHGRSAAAGTARCATCHTADKCAACHVAADRPEIEAIGYAPPDMELPILVSYYPRPATHDDEGWFGEHGTQASRAACATCHVQDDCTACHLSPLPAPASALPTRAQSLAPGVGVRGHAPESHGSVFFLDTHGTVAVTEGGSCATCHEDTFCTSCHEGPSDGGYHPAGFVARHAADAFGRDAECANCHSTEVFCRECHAQSGLTASGRLGPGYHAAGAFWLIRHGQAARQGLESCTSCHAQNDCTQCHGVTGAFKISPHGPDFDARTAWERSPRTCIACHLRNPLNGSEP